MVKWSRLLARLLCTGLLMAAAATAGAQSAAGYPNKPVRVIIPSAPGGSTDLSLAIFTERFTRELGQNFVFEHRPGGDTIVGTTAVAKAAPDGYTLLAVTTTVLINHWLFPDLSYDILKDLILIAPLTRSNSTLVISNSVPASNLKEFIAYARANPGKIDLASAASGTVLHYQRFMNATGTRFTIVNYKGPGQALTAVVGGHVQGFISGTGTVQSFIKTGKLRALGVGGDKRSPEIPDVPTFAEAGLKDYDPGNWYLLFAPAKTPGDIVEKLNTLVRRAETVPEVVDALAKQGLVPYGPMTVSQSNELIRTELERFGKLVKESGLKAEN